MGLLSEAFQEQVRHFMNYWNILKEVCYDELHVTLTAVCKQVEVKVKLSLYLTKQHTIKMHPLFY
jgi:hypothetical protein